MSPWEQFLQQNRPAVSPELEQFVGGLQAFNAADEARRRKLGAQPPPSVPAAQPKRQPSLLERVGSAARGVGEGIFNFGKGVVESTGQSLKSADEIIKAATGQYETQRRLLEALRKLLTERYNSGEITNQQFQSGLRRVYDAQSRLSNQLSKGNLATKDRTQLAGDVAQLVPDVLTLGIGSKLVLPAAEMGGKALAKRIVQSGLVEGAPIGAAYGVAQVASNKGDQATAKDYLAGAGIGAGFGLAAGAAGPLVGAAGPLVGAAAKKAANVTMPTVTESGLGKSLARSRLGQKIGDLKDSFVNKWINDINMIQKQFKGLTDTSSGRKISEEIEDRVTNVRQFAALSQHRLQNNQAYQELIPLIAGKKKRYEEFGKFISQKQQAINRRKLGRGGTVPVGTAEQEKAYSLLNQATKDDIQYLFDNGKITTAQYNKWMADPNYTRVQKEVLGDQARQFGKSGLVSGSSVTQQRLKGSTKQSVDPFAAYEDWSRQVTLEVEKNSLAKYLRDQLVLNGKSNKIQTTDSALERVRRIYGDEGVKQRTLPVFENGVKELYTLDPAAARQLAGVADIELKAIADWALLPSRVLRGGATSMNPAFAVPNFIRDQIFSYVTSKNALATHNPLVFMQGLKEAIFKPSLKATVGRLPGAKVLGKLWEPSAKYREWLSRNANITRVDLARNLKKATRQSLENLGVKRESFLRKYENIISAGEKATRYQNFLGTYKNALKKGKAPEQALALAHSASRTNSVNFSSRGELATFMKIFNPYFNANVQGSRTLARALKERPVPTALKIGTVLMAPVAAATYYNLSDPDRAAVYANIPDYERRQNLIMVLGNNRGYIKVPLTPGLREFANPLRNLIESEYLGDRQGFLATAKNLLVDPFSPVGTTVNEAISNTLPQAARPAVEVALNKSLFTGREVVPSTMRALPAEEQAFKKTPQIYRDIARVLGVSPLQVQKVVQGYTAGAGEGTLVLADLLRGAQTGGRSTPEQLAGRFFASQPKGSGRVSEKFYEAYNPLRARRKLASGKITEAIKSGDISKASQLALDMNNKIEDEKKRLRTTYGRFEVDLTGLMDRLDGLKFPMSGQGLSARSVKSRQRQ